MVKCDFCNKENAVKTKYVQECMQCPHKHGLYGDLLEMFTKCENCDGKRERSVTHTLCDECHGLMLKGESYHRIMVILANKKYDY
jgi:hypothetical protein